MTELEQVWRRKSDYELLAASRRLGEYSEAAQQVIKAEIDRRKSPEYLEALESAPQPPAVDQPPRNSDAPPSETSSSAWLAQRVALAIGLMIGFYLFAVGIALTLLWIPYATYVYLHLINAQIALICISSGLTILWALVPRPDRFTPPGPRLDAETCPRLFSLVDRVAEATSQQPPSDVYLLDTVNAFVAQRGGVMGFGSRRVMGIGLPLLQTVTVPEFEAIVAHEFGHYSSNDVALGPWIYKTRATIVRTIASIGKKSIRAPFLWYARGFLRLTHGVSRRQEFIADQISARVVGARVVASALTRASVAAQLYPAYVSQEVLPVLNSGFIPPISSGFDEFLASDQCREASRSIAAGLEPARPLSPYDTHPSLGERLAAVGVTMSNDNRDSGEPAATLIDHRDQHARALLEVAAGSERVHKLKPIEWSAVGGAVYPPRWRGLVKQYAPFLSRYTPESLPWGRTSFVRAGSDLVRDGENVTVDQRIGRAAQVFAAAVSVALVERGWEVHTRPGSSIALVRGAETFDLSGTLGRLANGTISLEDWRATCHAMGIAGQSLAAASGVAALSAPAPMPILPPPLAPNEVNCWRCKQALVVTPETRGKTIKCPQCRAKQQLPL